VPMTCANNRFTSMRCDGNGSCSTTYIQICSGGCSTGVCRN
jgi:hypothetical protein